MGLGDTVRSLALYVSLAKHDALHTAFYATHKSIGTSDPYLGEKNESLETASEASQMVGLENRDFKGAVENKFQEPMESML